MAKIKKSASFFIVIAAILWGLDGILRRSLFTLPPIIIVFYEHAIGALLITPFLLKFRNAIQFTRREILALIWVSLLSGLLGTLWFTTALTKVNFIPFSVVFLLQKLQPLFAATTAAILLKEKLTRPYLTWATVALVAAFFLTFPNGQVNWQSGHETIAAAAFALAAAFAWGSSTAFSRYTLLNHPQTLITGLRFWITTVLALPVIILFNQTATLASPTPSQLARLTTIALSTGMVALWLYYKGLKFTQAKISTILELAFPITAVTVDIAFYHTLLAPSQYFAALVLVFTMIKVSHLNQSVETKKVR